MSHRFILLLSSLCWATPLFALEPDQAVLGFDYESVLVDYSELSAAQKTALARGESVRFPIEANNREGVQAFVQVPVSRPVVWAGLKRYAQVDQWLHGVESITGVTWQTPITAQAHYTIGSPFRDVHYVLRRTHLAPDRIRWNLVSGDLEYIYGGYDLYQLDNGKTLIRYGSFMKFDFWVPPRIKRRSTLRGLEKTMASFQTRFSGNWQPANQ